MKLELKHLAGYLPYGLQMYWEDSNGVVMDSWTLQADNVTFVLINQNKPILRALSDLKKYIGDFCFEEWVNESSGVEELEQYTSCIYKKLSDGSPVNLHHLPYRIIKKMYEYHFDVERLIEAGLAIDINTL